MNEHERTDDAEDVVARLRAADPARGARVDLPALRAAVEARRDPAGARLGAPPGAGEPGLVVVDELAARRRSRTAWPARIAAAAASVLLVGGGGYALGLGAGSAVVADGPTAEQTVPGSDSSVSYNVDGPRGESTSPTASGELIAPTEGGGGDAAYGGVSAMMPYGYWQRVVFTAAGLSTEGGTAQVYALDASAVATEGRVTQIAAAFGVAGEARFTDYSWQVGPEDGSGPRVDLYVSGDASLSYYDPGAGTFDCPIWFEGASDEYLNRPCVERDLGPAPSEQEGIDRAIELLGALGFDPATFQMGVPEWADAMYGLPESPELVIEARPYLDGQRIDQVWTFSFTGAGLQSAYGSVAEIVPLGEYPVVSPAEAAARLGDPRFSGGGWLGPVDTVAGSPLRAAASEQEYVEVAPTVPATPAPGTAVSWPVSSATLTSAELSLTMHYQNDGAVLLIPTYRLYSDDGGIWQVIAVADSALDFSDGR